MSRGTVVFFALIAVISSTGYAGSKGKDGGVREARPAIVLTAPVDDDLVLPNKRTADRSEVASTRDSRVQRRSGGGRRPARAVGEASALPGPAAVARRRASAFA